MKNLLILHNSLDYTKSGVERVSFLLKKELTDRGYSCYEGCITGENKDHREDVFVYNFNDSPKKVLADIIVYIKKYDISIIINQGLFDPNINYVIAHLKKHNICKNIFCLHNAPSAYARKMPLSILEQVKIFIWYLLKFQIIIFDYRNHRLKMLAEMINITDKFILLSSSYNEELKKIVSKKSLNNVISISNPLTFQTINVDLSQKKNKVLVLCRLDDFQKNISASLRIWKNVEELSQNNWELIIAGSGQDEKKLKKYANKLQLKKVSFVGATSKPEKYYQECAIFMMTSNIEGWPMTLPESQQFGCIPIAFNTFAALSEIIQNDVNGIIIEKNNEQDFTRKICELMENHSMRQRLAQNCIKECQKYSSKKIGDKWQSLLQLL